MLPSNLLTVWKRKGIIQPRYAQLSAENLQVAKKLIEAHKHGIGKKKKNLKKVADTFEDEGYDYHFVRGLSLLLDRRSVFKCTSKANPFAFIVYGTGTSNWLLCPGAGHGGLTRGPSILFLPEYLSRVPEYRPATDYVYSTCNKQGDQ